MVQEQQKRTLAALSECILPSDDGPGAAEAGVATYIERILPSLSPQTLRSIASGLDLVECLALQHHGKNFFEGSPEERLDVLQRLERIPHRLTHKFLAVLVDLTLEGFFCDSSYGGNQDLVGWRYIGYQPRGPVSR